MKKRLRNAYLAVGTGLQRKRIGSLGCS